MFLAQDIRDSAKWLIGSNVMSQLLQFAIGVTLARLLVPADFGMIVTIQVFTGALGLIASGGMGQALIRAKTATEFEFQVVFTLQLLICLSVFILLFLTAPIFARYFGNALYEDLLRVSAINFFLRPFLNIHTSYLNREMRFKDLSIQNFIASFVGGIASVVMAVAGLGVWSLVFGGLSGSIASLLMVARTTPLRARLRFDREATRTHGNFGLRITLKDLAVYFRKQTSNLIIAKMGGPTMVGLFNKGYSLATLPFSAISGPVFQPVFRTMSAEQDNPDKIKYLFLRMMSLLMLYTLPLYIALAWLAEPLIVVVYGENWRDAAPVLQILAPLGLLHCISHPCGAVLAATNRVGSEAVVQVVTWAIVTLGCIVGLKYGLVGAAVGIVFSQVYSATHMYILATRSFKLCLHEFFKATAPTLTLNLALIAIFASIESLYQQATISESNKFYLLLMGCGGGFFYLTAFMLLPIESLKSEAMHFRNTLKKFTRTSLPDNK